LGPFELAGADKRELSAEEREKLIGAFETQPLVKLSAMRKLLGLKRTAHLRA
jgi:hypothetical protein